MPNIRLGLDITHPELAAQAIDWDPSTFFAGSNKKVLWKCEKGHQWHARIVDRIRFNSGCQVCANRVVLEGFNDLATTHPILAAQALRWDPRTVHKGMTQKVLWKCEKGHEWYAQINARTRQGQGCPFCSGRLVLAGANDLASLNPALALEANGWDPTTVSIGSSRKLSWKCKVGHEWLASVHHRSGGSACPICSNHQLLVGFNDLATKFPEIAKEADGWNPTTVMPGSGRKLKWRCIQDHTFSQAVNNRTGPQKQGCPVCAGKQTVTGINDLATKFPEIAKEADGWNPAIVAAGSNKKFQWKCAGGHIYQMAPKERTGKQKQGCPVCASKRILVGFNDLATTHPEIAKEADGWNPQELIAGTHHVMTWRCAKGHEFRASPNQRTSRTSNCPTCSNLVIEAGFNDLQTLFPALAKEANGWDPTTVGGGSSRRFSWKCSAKGHIWESTIINRTSNGTNCPVCVGQLVVVGINDLATTHPEIAKEAADWDPRSLTSGSKKKRAWRCQLDHIFIQSVGSRTGSNQTGCPYCSSTLLLKGFNDLQTKFPEIAVEADGWDPTSVMPGSGRKQKWRCNQGHTFFQVVNNRTGPQKQGCPTCAPTGFDPNKPGWLYFLDHDSLDMYQIGISNIPQNRLESHKRRGWEVIEVRGPMEGHLVQQLETAILHAIEQRGAILGHKAGIEKFDGYSEAWIKDSLKASNIKQMIDWVYEDDSEGSLNSDF
jgi:hypothetical protein